jgi:multidrug efflux system membrane fusion protein
METKSQAGVETPPSYRTDRGPRSLPEEGESNGATKVSTKRGDGELDYAPGTSPKPGNFLVLCLILVVAAAGLVWLVHHFLAAQAANAKAPRGPMTVPVVTAVARKGDMDIYLTGLGSVTPLNVVALHTRVDGQVDKVNFIEGAMVHQGDVLAELDPRPFQVQLEEAQGQLVKDQAVLKNAQLDLDRYKSAPGSFTQQQIDTQDATILQAQGAVTTDQGAIDSAKLNLVYCKITAPISGKIGFRLIDPGNIVHATDTTPLAVIAQLQPITVIFNLPEDNIQQVLKAAGKGGKLPVEAYGRDVTQKISSGTLLAIDNQADPTTATIRFKGTFPNTDSMLFPSQFVNARLLVDVRRDAVIVPSAAVQRSPTTTFVYVVKPEDTVDMRDVTIGPSEGDETLIAKGLQAGEVVVTDGVDKLQDGSKVMVDKSAMQGAAPTTSPSGAHAGHHHDQGSTAQQ